MKFLTCLLTLLIPFSGLAQNSLGQINVITGSRSVYVFSQENTTRTGIFGLPFGVNYNTEKAHFASIGLQAQRKASFREMLHFWTWGKISNYQIHFPNSQTRKGAEFDYTILALVKTSAPHGDFYMGFGPKLKYYLVKDSHAHTGLQMHFSHEAPKWDVRLATSLLAFGIQPNDLGILRDSSQLELEIGLRSPNESGFSYRYALEFNHTHRAYYASKKFAATTGAFFVDDAALNLKIGLVFP